jgi:uncharacterized protein (TIGR02145 family)
MKHIFTIITITALTLLAVLSGCKKNEPNNNTVKDICGNSYKYVKIGEQYWMAENMRCNKYDTQSERKGAELSTSSSETYAPYYTNASDKSKWNLKAVISENLSDEQISKLGYLYSWTAAVGLATAEAAEAQTSSFSSNRQGICPNGWHVPTNSEWDALGTALGGKKGDDYFPNVGNKLKTTSGWYMNGNGTDEYYFAALPAGFASFEYGSGASGVGGYANFWTATPGSYSSSYNAYAYEVFFNGGNLSNHVITKKDGYSVRCVKD